MAQGVDELLCSADAVGRQRQRHAEARRVGSSGRGRRRGCGLAQPVLRAHGTGGAPYDGRAVDRAHGPSHALGELPLVGKHLLQIVPHHRAAPQVGRGAGVAGRAITAAARARRVGRGALGRSKGWV